jgi:biopolymer transport protein ExbD
LRLPVASQVRDLEWAPVIAVSDEQITLNGLPVDDPQLHDDLVTLKNNFKLLHPGEHFHGTVVIAAEDRIQFATLKSILAACNLSGFADVQLLVRQRS